MHELSLVRNVIEIAREAVITADGDYATEITLEVGDLAGVEWQSFDFAWKMAVKDTVLNNAKRIIEEVHGQARCNICHAEFELEQLFDSCPVCGSFDKTILKGDEFRVKSLRIHN